MSFVLLGIYLLLRQYSLLCNNYERFSDIDSHAKVILLLYASEDLECEIELWYVQFIQPCTFLSGNDVFTIICYLSFSGNIKPGKSSWSWNENFAKGEVQYICDGR